MLTDEYARTRVDGTWRFNELFDAMKPNGAFGNPEFDVDEALVEGQIIQFFEQAFEWNNVTYRFYPYFWGRKENWRTTALLDDTDPQFATSCVPARLAWSCPSTGPTSRPSCTT